MTITTNRNASTFSFEDALASIVSEQASSTLTSFKEPRNYRNKPHRNRSNRRNAELKRMGLNY